MLTSRGRMTIATTLGAGLLLTGCMQSPPEPSTSPAPSTAATPAATGGAAEPSASPSAAPAEPSERGVLGRASVDVPEEWEQTGGDQTFTLRYAATDSPSYEAIAIADGFGSFQGARAGVSVFIAQAQTEIERFRILSQEDIEVPGASSAVRVDFTFGSADDPSDGMWVVAVDDRDGHAIAIAYSGGEAEVDDAELDAVAGSVELLPAP